MVLTQEHRTTLFAALSQIATKDAAEAMLAEFPNHELDEPVTKGFVRAEIAETRTEIAQLRTEVTDLRGELRTTKAELHSDLTTQITGLRTDLEGKITGLRTDLEGKITGLRTDLEGKITDIGGQIAQSESHVDERFTRLREDIAQLQIRLVKLFNSQIMWIVGALIAALTVVGALAG